MASQAVLGSNLTQVVPFFHVAEMARSLSYYVDGLGFSPERKWVVDGVVRWCWLSRGSVAFMLQQFPADGHDSRAPMSAVKGNGVSICVMCEDAIALYREFKNRGIDASRPFVGNSLWVTTVKDPDGFRIDFESPADVPEETEYEG